MVTYSKLFAWTAILCAYSLAVCQSPPVKIGGVSSIETTYTPHMIFDVVSIRESRDGNFSSIDNVSKNSLFMGHRLSAWGLVITAYDIKLGRLLENVPSWAETIRLDVIAKSDSAADEALSKLSDDDSDAEKRHMLQQLLLDRFKLRIHTETRMSKTYELVSGKHTADRLKPVQADITKTISSCNIFYSKNGKEIDSKGCPFSLLLSKLRQELGTNVVDHTGLSGMYAFHLMWEWTSPRSEDNENRFPRLEDAISDQLGLELKETKGPVMFWVVDHIERPTAN